MNSPITTHVLDTAKGCPAAGIPVLLEQKTPAGWMVAGQGFTDQDGRVTTLLPPDKALPPADYRLVFNVSTYQDGFFPEVIVCFRIADPHAHYHVPLLLSPFGYSTYRGS